MTRRRHFPSQRNGDLFGVPVSFVALLASKSEPVEQAKRDAIMARVLSAVEDIAASADPDVRSWRDLTDAMNFFQSMVEMKFAQDEAGNVEAFKEALLQAHQAWHEHGKVRAAGPGLQSLRELATQFREALEAISAHSYWQIVVHTQRRITRIQRGKTNPDDIVVSL